MPNQNNRSRGGSGPFFGINSPEYNLWVAPVQLRGQRSVSFANSLTYQRQSAQPSESPPSPPTPEVRVSPVAAFSLIIREPIDGFGELQNVKREFTVRTALLSAVVDLWERWGVMPKTKRIVANPWDIEVLTELSDSLPIPVVAGRIPDQCILLDHVKGWSAYRCEKL